MANPTKYSQTYDFSDFAADNPSTPLPGVQVDIQLAAIETASHEVVDALADIRRSDGALVNGIVTEDSLEVGLVASITAVVSAAETAAETAQAAAEDAADEAEASAATLQSAIDVIEDNGFILDWGFFSEAPGDSKDWGNFQ